MDASSSSGAKPEGLTRAEGRSNWHELASLSKWVPDWISALTAVADQTFTPKRAESKVRFLVADGDGSEDTVFVGRRSTRSSDEFKFPPDSDSELSAVTAIVGDPPEAEPQRFGDSECSKPDAAVAGPNALVESFVGAGPQVIAETVGIEVGTTKWGGLQYRTNLGLAQEGAFEAQAAAEQAREWAEFETKIFETKSEDFERWPPLHCGIDSGVDDDSSGVDDVLERESNASRVSDVTGDTYNSDSDEAEDTGSSWTSTAAAARQQKRQPVDPVQRVHGVSSWTNQNPEVGNVGLYFGNWGTRSTTGGKIVQKARNRVFDTQVTKNPTQLLVLCEVTKEVEAILKAKPQAGDPDGNGLEQRPTCEYLVVRGNEESSILVAARVDTAVAVESLEYHVSKDFEYTEKGNPKTARSRILAAKATMRQSVGHIGSEIKVIGAHGNMRTMKFEKGVAPHRNFFNKLAEVIEKYGIHFLCGDFNMSFTQVCKLLRLYGIRIELVAWHPWQQSVGANTVPGLVQKGQSTLGFDSCGIWYIGGRVKVSMPWNLTHIDELTAVAGKNPNLPIYDLTNNHPGQPWQCYRSFKNKESNPEDKDLRARLVDLLTPDTTQEELDQIAKTKVYCPYLKLKQKPMKEEYWLVDGKLHNGAHFPLCVFTTNSRYRSQEGQARRAEKYNRKGKPKGEKGGGKGGSQKGGSKGNGEKGGGKHKGNKGGETAVAGWSSTATATGGGTAWARPAPPGLALRSIAPAQSWCPSTTPS